MKPHNNPRSDATYQIQIQGKLDQRWADWFNGMIVDPVKEETSTTTLTVKIADQAKLRGILNKLWDMNMTVISLSRIQTFEE